MSFFSTSDGQQITSTGVADMSESMEPIPAKTRLLATIDEAKWDQYEGQHYISLRWAVIDPSQYKNRKIFHKLKVEDVDSGKRDKALRMLAAIDANAGGKLQAAGIKPTSELMMMHLSSRPMFIEVEVWEMNGKSGNWVSKVAPRAAVAPQAPAADNFDDIPF